MSKQVPIEKIVLDTLSILGQYDYNFLPSNVLRILNRQIGNKYNKKYVLNAISRLKSKGLIKMSSEGGLVQVGITKSGRSKLNDYKSAKNPADKNKRWDGKWRIVTFDIKEKRKKARDKIRYEIKNFGFVLLQNSVWVYPYDCEEYIGLLKADEQIGKSLLYIVADRIEMDRDLKKIFNL